MFGINSMREKLRSPGDMVVGRNSLHGKEDNFLKIMLRVGDGGT